jgi:hypothetical protein
VIRRVAQSGAGALFGTLAGASALVLFYAFAPGLALEMDHDRAPQLTGFYGGERNGSLTFAWTRGTADVRLPGLDRGMEWHVRVRLRGARTDLSALPVVTLLADGAPIAHLATSNEFADLTAEIPAQAGFARGLTLSLQSSTVFVPGGSDPRTLGVQVDRIEVLPAQRGTFPPRRAVAGASAASGIFGAIFGLLGATATTAIGAATVLAVGQAAVLRLGFGPFAPWTHNLAPLAAAIGIALLIIVASIETRRGEPLRNTARFALMFTASALYLKLMVLLHPDMWLANALFHAHRLSDVLGGHLLITSTTAGGSTVPYGIGLYLAAVPFARLATDTVVLLRVMTAVADAVACGLIYWLVSRCSGDRLMAAIAVAIAQLMPLGLAMQAAADLTIVFAGAMALVAVVLAGGLLTQTRTRWWALAAVAATSLAFLSHTGTLVALALTLTIAGGRLVVRDRGRARHAGISVLAVVAASLALAVLLYYGRFAIAPAGALAQGAQISADVLTAHSSMPATRVVILRELGTAYTWPFLLLALAGVVVGHKRFGGTAFWVLVTSWLLAAVVVLAASFLLPLDFHPYYSALPAVAICAAVAVSAGWRGQRRARTTVAVLSALGAIAGIHHWLGVLGGGLF